MKPERRLGTILWRAAPVLVVFAIIGAAGFGLVRLWQHEMAVIIPDELASGTARTVTLVAGKDYHVSGQSVVENVPDNEMLAAFPMLQDGFSDLSFSMDADANIAKSAIEKTVSLSESAGRVASEYSLDGMRITTEYRENDSISKQSENQKMLGGGEGSISIKQTITLKNDQDQEKKVAFSVRTKIAADKVVWDGREYRLTGQHETFRAYEKTASVPEFAKDMGQKDLKGIDAFKDYTHTYTVGSSLSFADKDGNMADYDWSDALAFHPEVVAYREGDASYIELRLSGVTVPAYGETVIDPDYDLASGAGYTARYDGAYINNSISSIAVSDVNGDGFSDLVISSPYASNNSRTGSGSVYIVFRKADSPSGVQSLDVAAHYNIRYDGAAAGDTFGSAVVVGDVNGDSHSDLIVGASTASNNSRSYSGSVYVFFSTLIDDVGATTGNNLDLATGTNYNIRYDGAAAGDTFGSAVVVGDVNGDSHPDLIAGVPYASNNSRSASGSAYVFFSTLIDDVGATTGNNLDLATGTNYNIRYDGAEAGDFMGQSVTTGDVNGDSYPDLVLGTPDAGNNARSGSGSVYVFFSTLIDDVGATTGNNLDLATGTNYNIRYDGAEAGDFMGQSVTTGDVNGDSHSDLIVGASTASNNSRSASGSAYVFFSTLIDDVGATTGNNLDLATGTNYNIRYDGAVAGDYIGQTATTGDVNGDSHPDLIVGASTASNNSRSASGSAYVFFSTLIDDVGATTGNNLDLATGTNYNIRYDGAVAGDYIGQTATTGDVNGDSHPDLIVGASTASNNSRSASGSAYVFFSTLIDDVGATTGNNLDLATGTNYNIRYDGAVAGDYMGQSVTTGDVNSDGYSDMIAQTQASSGDDLVYILFSTLIDDVGATTGNNFDLATSTNYSARFDGAPSLGTYVDGRLAIGDVNGDGIDDLVIGGVSIYVIFGGQHPTGNRLLTVAGNYNIRYNSVSTHIAIGDVNGDGFSDLVIGSSSASNNSRSYSGSVYVFFSTLIDDVGATTGNNKDLATGTNYNIRYDGAVAEDTLGSAVVIGDVNGDSHPDLIVGAPYASNNSRFHSGSVYVFFSTLIDDVGATTGNDKDLATGTNYNIRYDGVVTSGYYGEALFTGDVNGDGYADLVLGNGNTSYNSRAYSGSAYVFFSTLIDDVGATTGNNLDLATGTNYNIRYDGATASARLVGAEGAIVIGDVNGDSHPDLIVGAPYTSYNSRSASGSAYVFFSTLIDDVGATTGNNLDLAIGTNYNIRYDGAAAEDRLTYGENSKVLTAGDVNGDGYPDLVFGSSYIDNNSRSYSGSVYVLFSTLIDDVGATTGNNKDLATGTNYNIRYDGAAAGDWLAGYSGVIIGDADGDGHPDLVFGTSLADNNSRTNSGALYMLSSTLIDDVGATTGNDKDLATGTNYSIRYDGALANDGLASVPETIAIGNLGGKANLAFCVGTGPYNSGSVYIIEKGGPSAHQPFGIQGQAKFNGAIKLGH